MPDQTSSIGMERKLAAIFSTDVAGYSRLMGDDEEATIRTFTAYREVIATLIQQHRGRVVDAPGDNLLAEFASVVDAVRCAVEIQHALKEKNAELPDHRRMQFRIGINLGDVIIEGERLYGDGVNIAARLESLAIPGGICISGTVYDQIETKLSLHYEYQGEQIVKNIAKPVRVYRLQVEESESPQVAKPKARRAGIARRNWTTMAVAGLLLIAGTVVAVRFLSFSPLDTHYLELVTEEAQPPLLPLPDKPSIVVLPFVNMSEDPKQDYFSDGLTEDLTFDLSKISSLFVIARNSAFTYKGKAVKVQDVGREMGVRYVLEGSVQKEDQRIRITAQLIEATTGYHLWSEQYDRPLTDIFALQDEIVQKIVTTLKLQLTLEEQGYIVRKTTDNLEAYDYYLRGVDAFHRFTKEANIQARQLYEKAIELDPQYAYAYAGLGGTYYIAWIWRWSQDPQTLEQVLAIAQKAITLDDTLPGGHGLLGLGYAQRRQYDQALAESERTIALDPNSADSYAMQAEVLNFAGRPEEALRSVEQAMRLNPRYPV
jgi:adenylate cyclase